MSSWSSTAAVGQGAYLSLGLETQEMSSLKLAGAVALCRYQIKNGNIYRADKWQKPQK